MTVPSPPGQPPAPTTVSPAQISAAYQALLARRLALLALLGGAILVSVLLDFSLGPAGLSPAQLLHTLLHPSTVSDSQRIIVWQIRLPYALMAVCVGAALGLSGAEMQTILANPLASPFTLGVSAAAAFGASLALVLGLHLPGLPDSWLIAGNAFICAVGSVFLLDLVGHLRQARTSTVVLFGIALVFTFQALVSLMQFMASEDALQELVFWTMGSLTRTSWPKLGLLAALGALVVPFSFLAAWSLTTLRMGEERAASLGVNVPRVRRWSLLRVSLLSALAVSFVGIIGFVGLVAPHIARRLLGEDHRFYLPGSMLAGALILSLSSVTARVLIPGVIIPTGIVTALVGIPVFLSIVLRQRDLS
ncbi:MAG: iron ABC transporter permease [Acetobacter persici]